MPTRSKVHEQAQKATEESHEDPERLTIYAENKEEDHTKLSHRIVQNMGAVAELQPEEPAEQIAANLDNTEALRSGGRLEPHAQVTEAGLRHQYGIYPQGETGTDTIADVHDLVEASSVPPQHSLSSAVEGYVDQSSDEAGQAIEAALCSPNTPQLHSPVSSVSPKIPTPSSRSDPESADQSDSALFGPNGRPGSVVAHSPGLSPVRSEADISLSVEAGPIVHAPEPKVPIEPFPLSSSILSPIPLRPFYLNTAARLDELSLPPSSSFDFALPSDAPRFMYGAEPRAPGFRKVSHGPLPSIPVATNAKDESDSVKRQKLSAPVFVSDRRTRRPLPIPPNATEIRSQRDTSCTSYGACSAVSPEDAIPPQCSLARPSSQPSLFTSNWRRRARAAGSIARESSAADQTHVSWMPL
ncbi:uncharacterized protein JCM15063_000195 [Sporobolomyces koalae]|uniref:uncharacterized protein n=1 Tax=Sporobolomyces koalae TaxID=500713 RepID=UPI00317426ED